MGLVPNAGTGPPSPQFGGQPSPNAGELRAVGCCPVVCLERGVLADSTTEVR
jgi:hypothetical protein